MKLTKVLLAVAVSASVGFIGCKPKDADLQKSIQEKEPAYVSVTVLDAVATLSGDAPDAAAKTSAGDIAQGVKGVKSVTNNLVVAPPPPPPPVVAPVVITLDDPLTKAVTDATKDFPTVQATVKEGVITVTGEISADKWKKLKMSLDGLKPKKVDGSALTIK